LITIPFTQQTFYVLLLTWVLFLILFLWSLSGILAPIVLFFVLIYLLAPFYGTKLYGRLVTTLALLTLFWLIWTAGFILAPFVLALVLAYILNPLVKRAEREGLGRTLATVTVLATFLLMIVMVGLLLGPVLAQQLSAFVSSLPEFIEGAVRWLEGLIERISHIPLPGRGPAELGDFIQIDRERVEEYVASRREAIGEALLTGALGIGKGLGIVFTAILSLLLVFVATFFLLRDFDKLVENAARLVPPHRRPKTFAFFRAYNELLGRFLRSQLLVALLVGAVIGVGLAIVGFPYALLIGVLAGVFNVVPYLGFWVALVPATLIALVSGDVLVNLLKVGAVFGVEQALENYLAPRIVGQSVGLHPVWVMLAIVVAGVFFGFVGVLIAVPAAAAIKLLLVNLVETYETSAYYRGTESESVGAPVVVPAEIEEKA